MPSFTTAQVSSLCPYRAWLLLAGLAAAAPAAWAADGQFADDTMAAWQEESSRSATHPGYEVNSLVLPSLDDPLAWGASQRPGFGDGSNATQRIDVTRWLTPDAPHRVGMSLGLNAAAPPAGAFAAQGQGPVSLDLGVRWRSRLEGGRHLDVSAWAQPPQRGPSPDAMGLIWQAQQPVYGTRVEVQWASSRTRGLVPEFGAIGVQLQGNSRLVLRAKKGGPMLYYRAKF